MSPETQLASQSLIDRHTRCTCTAPQRHSWSFAFASFGIDDEGQGQVTFAEMTFSTSVNQQILNLAFNPIEPKHSEAAQQAKVTELDCWDLGLAFGTSLHPGSGFVERAAAAAYLLHTLPTTHQPASPHSAGSIFIRSVSRPFTNLTSDRSIRYPREVSDALEIYSSILM